MPSRISVTVRALILLLRSMSISLFTQKFHFLDISRFEAYINKLCRKIRILLEMKMLFLLSEIYYY